MIPWFGGELLPAIDHQQGRQTQHQQNADGCHQLLWNQDRQLLSPTVLNHAKYCWNIEPIFGELQQRAVAQQVSHAAAEGHIDQKRPQRLTRIFE